jgi:hypothetical protein
MTDQVLVEIKIVSQYRPYDQYPALPKAAALTRAATTAMPTTRTALTHRRGIAGSRLRCRFSDSWQERAIAEVGAIIIVGGNIRGYTRTMTTTITLETSKGDLALALGLGLILILLSVSVGATAFFLAGWSARGRS